MDREKLIQIINDSLNRAGQSDLELIAIFVCSYVDKTEKRKEMRG